MTNTVVRRKVELVDRFTPYRPPDQGAFYCATA